jgi:hypothetical protein
MHTHHARTPAYTHAHAQAPTCTHAGIHKDTNRHRQTHTYAPAHTRSSMRTHIIHISTHANTCTHTFALTSTNKHMHIHIFANTSWSRTQGCTFLVRCKVRLAAGGLLLVWAGPEGGSVCVCVLCLGCGLRWSAAGVGLSVSGVGFVVSSAGGAHLCCHSLNNHPILKLFEARILVTLVDAPKDNGPAFRIFPLCFGAASRAQQYGGHRQR